MADGTRHFRCDISLGRDHPFRHRMACCRSIWAIIQGNFARSAFSTRYHIGLFIAFTASQVWNDTARVNVAVATEASALRSVVVMSAVLPIEAQTELRRTVRDYIQYAATTEWPLVANGAVTLNVSPPTLNNALKFTLSLPVVTPGQQTAQREVAASLQHALEARRGRILISRSEVNGVKWLCLAFLAVCLLFAIAFVHCDNRLTSAVAIGLFSAALATTFLLILSHDRPFTGKVALTPEPLLQVMPENRGGCPLLSLSEMATRSLK